MENVKIDNANLTAKLKLRRLFLDEYHSDGVANVIDCCQAEGRIWRELRKTHRVGRYMGVDIKSKKGRLRMDSVKLLMSPGIPYDVIDIDTYGAPWKHVIEVRKNISQPTTVFLTIGLGLSQQTPLPHDALRAIGLGPLVKHLPKMLQSTHKFGGLVDQSMLASGPDCNIIQIVEAINTKGTARYLGVRMEPKGNGSQSSPASRPTH